MILPLRLLASAIALLVLTFAAPALAGPRTIVIGKPGVEPVPTAVPALRYTEAARPLNGEPLVHLIIADTLRRDLQVVGEFKILDPKGYLENPQTTEVTPSEDSFSDWYIVGAELLIKGEVDRRGNELIVELYAYDVFQRQFIFAKRYTGTADTVRSMAHMFANAMMEKLTGKTGPFDSEIVFTVRTGKTSKNTASTEITGDNIRWLTDNSALNLYPVWSRDGASCYLTSYYGGSPDLCRYTIKNDKLRYVYQGEGPDMPGTESPDGKTLLFAATHNGNMDIYSLDLKKKRKNRITTSRGIDVSPDWSPDGKQIVFVSDRRGNPNLYVMDAAGGKPKRITFSGKQNADPAWSPDGDKIAYSCMDGKGIFQVCIADPQGQNAVMLTTGRYDVHDPSWSPDGRFLAVTSNKDGKDGVFVLRLGINRLWRVSPKGQTASQPHWSYGPVLRVR